MEEQEVDAMENSRLQILQKTMDWKKISNFNKMLENKTPIMYKKNFKLRLKIIIILIMLLLKYNQFNYLNWIKKINKFKII